MVRAMTTPVETVKAFVEAFVQARPEQDAETVSAFFTEDAVYANGPLEPVFGRDAIRSAIAEFMAMGGEVGVELRHLVGEGPIVLTERVDHFTAAGRTISLPVMGTFEVRDGRISAWRDYFDLNQFAAQMDPGT
jgi:limonene-1,2-epoxide hydrolase